MYRARGTLSSILAVGQQHSGRKLDSISGILFRLNANDLQTKQRPVLLFSLLGYNCIAYKGLESIESETMLIGFWLSHCIRLMK